MTTRQQTAFNFFLAKGYVREGAAAIVGNLSQESGVNLTSAYTLKTDHGSQGVAQWRLDRLTNLEKFAEANHMNVVDLTTQMLFIIDELTKIYPALNAQLRSGGRSVANLTANFMQIFERPSAQYADLPNRIEQAKRVIASAQTPPGHDGPIVTVPEAVGTGAVATAGAGGAAYAWSNSFSGPLTAALVIFACAALLLLVFYINKRFAKTGAVYAIPMHELGTKDELQAAIDEFKVAGQRLDAAQAVLLIERRSSDDLLLQVKELKAHQKEQNHDL